MHNFRILLAGKVISATVQYESTRDFCRDYLTDMKEDVAVRVTSDDIIAEKLKSDRERELEGTVEFEPSAPYLETLALYRKIAESLVEFGIILFHGSAVALDGEVYLFTARSGTGKSTHTRLWREVFGEHAVMVNDDKPLIRVSDDGVTVFGTPWNGKHRLGANISAPLKAICVLERAQENSIVPLDRQSAFPYVLSQTYRFSNPLGMRNTLAILDLMLQQVRTYRLGCNMDREAAIVAYNGMK